MIVSNALYGDVFFKMCLVIPKTCPVGPITRIGYGKT